MYEDLIRQANSIIGPRKTAEIFHRSENLAYKWANSGGRSIDQSPNQNPIQSVAEFLAYLSSNGGHKTAIRILAVFCQAINNGSNKGES